MNSVIKSATLHMSKSDHNGSRGYDKPSDFCFMIQLTRIVLSINKESSHG